MVQIYYRHIRSERLKTLESAKIGSWINALAPTETELRELAETYGLDHGLLLDGIDPYESPRVESEDGSTYIFTRFCYTDNGRIATSPLLIIYSRQHIITVSPKPLSGLSHLTQGKVALVTTQRTKLLLQILDEARFSYERNLNTLSKTISQIRSQLKKESISNQDFITFIDIEETLGDFLSGLVPTAGLMRNLLSGRYFKLYEEDEDLIEDLSLGISELIDLTRSRLAAIVNIREAYSTIMANNLNRIFKLLTSITILMTIPTIITSVYSMNVTTPFMHTKMAFWIITAFILLLVSIVAWLFKRNKWF